MKIFIIGGIAACLLSSCLKNKDILDYRGIEPVIINPKSNFPAKSFFASPLIDSAFGVTRLNLTARYSFQQPAPGNINITFSKDDALVTAYNQTFRTNYLPLPADSYEMPGVQAIIQAGTNEGILPIKIFPSKISGPNNYIIAFTITASGENKIGENFKSIVYTLKGQ